MNTDSVEKIKLDHLTGLVDELRNGAKLPAASRDPLMFCDDEQLLEGATQSLIKEALEIFLANPELEKNEFFSETKALVLDHLGKENARLNANFKSKYGACPDDPDYEKKIAEYVSKRSAQMVAEALQSCGIEPQSMKPTPTPEKLHPSNGTSMPAVKRAAEIIGDRMADQERNRFER